MFLIFLYSYNGIDLRDGMIKPTFRDLQSSHETLSGLDSRCLLRLPDASGPSLSEASSSPLHASSSACSAALAGELSVSFWFIVGAGSVAGEKEPSLRMARSYSKQLPRHNTPSSHSMLTTAEATKGQLRMDGIPHHRTMALSRVSVFDGWPI